MADGKSQTASTAAQIDRACWAWRNDKHRETVVAERFHAIADKLDDDD